MKFKLANGLVNGLGLKLVKSSLLGSFGAVLFSLGPVSFAKNTCFEVQTSQYHGPTNTIRVTDNKGNQLDVQGLSDKLILKLAQSRGQAVCATSMKSSSAAKANGERTESRIVAADLSIKE